MIRLHHAGKLKINTAVTLSKEASHRLVHVMRLKTGSQFSLFNSDGEFIVVLKKIDKKIAIGQIIESVKSETESFCKITLLQAVTRRERMDFSIQKATELGVSIIQPVITQHCVVKLDTKKIIKRMQHWKDIAQHATEQSGRLLIPEIKPVISWGEAVQNTLKIDSLNLIFTLAAAKPLSQLQKSSKQVTLAIGPVGGFSDQEIALAINNNFQGIKLGPRILRSETATTAALTAIQMRWGDLD